MALTARRALIESALIAAALILAGVCDATAQQCSIQPQVQQEIAPWVAAMQVPGAPNCTIDEMALRSYYWILGAIRQCGGPTMEADLENTNSKIAESNQNWIDDGCGGSPPRFAERSGDAASPGSNGDNSNGLDGGNNGANAAGNTDNTGTDDTNNSAGNAGDGGDNTAANTDNRNVDSGSDGTPPTPGTADSTGESNAPDNSGTANDAPPPANSDTPPPANTDTPADPGNLSPGTQQFAAAACAEGGADTSDCANEVATMTSPAGLAAAQEAFAAASAAPNVDPLPQSQLPDSCGFFTHPTDIPMRSGDARYTNGAFVCYKSEGYGCDDDQWVDKGVCLDPNDPDTDATAFERSYVNGF